jgi:hypothetical protein
LAGFFCFGLVGTARASVGESLPSAVAVHPLPLSNWNTWLREKVRAEARKLLLAEGSSIFEATMPTEDDFSDKELGRHFGPRFRAPNKSVLKLGSQTERPHDTIYDSLIDGIAGIIWGERERTTVNFIYIATNSLPTFLGVYPEPIEAMPDIKGGTSSNISKRFRQRDLIPGPLRYLHVIWQASRNPSTFGLDRSVTRHNNTCDYSKSGEKGKKCSNACQAIKALRNTYLSLRNGELLDSYPKVFLFLGCVIVPILLVISLFFFDGAEYRFGALYYSFSALSTYTIIVTAIYFSR